MEFSANPKAAVLAHVHSPSMQGRREQPRGFSTGILEVLEVNPGHIVSSKPAWAIHCDPIKKKTHKQVSHVSLCDFEATIKPSWQTAKLHGWKISHPNVQLNSKAQQSTFYSLTSKSYLDGL